jgi:hypothetical protein
MKTTIIPKAEFEKHDACRAYLDSPKWNASNETLLIDDEAVAIMLSDRQGVVYFNWLVTHGLVPMTMTELNELLKERGIPAR